MNFNTTLKSKLISLHNSISDKNFIWFPFVFLKPKIKEEIAFRKTIFMALCFGPYFELIIILRKILFSNFQLDWSELSLGFLLWILGFLIWFNLVTRPAWNIRAKERSESLPSQ